MIRYRLIEAAGHSCLIREEVHPDSLSRDNQTRELVCTEIHGIVVTSPEDGAVTLPEKVEGFFVQVPEGELPTQLNVALYGSHPDQADFSYGFMLR